MRNTTRTITLQESKNRAKLFVNATCTPNSSWFDLELYVGEDEMLYFDVRLLNRDFETILTLFDKENDNYMKTVFTSSCFELPFYAGIDQSGNKYMGFEYLDEKLYFLWKSPFIDFLKNPSETSLTKFNDNDDNYFNSKDFFITNTGKAKKALEKVIEQIQNFPNYDLFDFENKETYFYQVFEYQLSKLYNLKFEDLDELERNNISYLAESFFKSTL